MSSKEESTMKANMKYVYLVTTVAALGGLLFGYDTAVIAGAIGFLQSKFELSSAMTGWAASSAIWGCLFGAMFAGYASDKLGRKKVLLATAILFSLSAIGSALPNNLTQFVTARFIGGLGVGAASMLSPLYISEIAPAKLRGMLVSLYQLAIVLGINFVYFVNLKIANVGTEAWNIEMGWRYMLGSEIIPALLFFILLFLVPESPRWLTLNGKEDEAATILEKVNGKEEGRQILNEIKETIRAEKGTLKELFATKFRRALIIGLVLALFSQITGINAIIYYAPEIFRDIGFGTDSALQQTVIIGFVNTIFTFVAIYFIDRMGRRTLLLLGLSGMIICLLGTGLVFYFGHSSSLWTLIFILGFIASFASSLGPIPWVIMSEIFPTKIRGLAMSFATMTLWLGVVAITQFTPIMLENLGGAYTFWTFMANAVFLLIFVYKRVPETKGRTLEEIEKSWKDK
ncbi:MFS transporter, SP family, arabinose:H+ symporter [Arenibacter palladensis]|uniref:MFS transporter, SP family, arabinose:H+ symporter n=1 Tax=Arenibacter palladensis TaxID=237373 RepID=A0A1M4STR9_9FLAO|nr:sugar porter family MFS transporter [Arenibacter palladensis]SHE35640.1 MFS transporter, SP family, arabinose:H+ symporter [Arenibacter palladensis]